MMYSSTSGGAGTMAENVVAGSVPIATATSMRSPLRLPIVTWGIPAILRPRGCCLLLWLP